MNVHFSFALLFIGHFRAHDASRHLPSYKGTMPDATLQTNGRNGKTRAGVSVRDEDIFIYVRHLPVEDRPFSAMEKLRRLFNIIATTAVLIVLAIVATALLFAMLCLSMELMGISIDDKSVVMVIVTTIMIQCHIGTYMIANMAITPVLEMVHTFVASMSFGEIVAVTYCGISFIVVMFFSVEVMFMYTLAILCVQCALRNYTHRHIADFAQRSFIVL
jgi:hypothetical protein